MTDPSSILELLAGLGVYVIALAWMTLAVWLLIPPK